MKKIIVLFIGIVSTFVCVSTTYAANPTPTASVSATPTKANGITELEKKIQDDIITHVASTVAKLKLTEPRGVLGTVTEVSDSQITINNLSGESQLVDIDEFTKFSSPSAKESFGISDIQKGTILGILGRYNKQSKRILARFVGVETLPKVLHGAILSIDPDNFILKVITDKGQQLTVDIEEITKTTAAGKDGTVSKSGFSKLLTNQHVVITGYASKTQKNRITASRILVFPDIPKSPRIPNAAPALDSTEDVTTSTGSGTKLTPLK